MEAVKQMKITKVRACGTKCGELSEETHAQAGHGLAAVGSPSPQLGLLPSLTEKEEVSRKTKT